MTEPDWLENATASAFRDVGGEPTLAWTGRDNNQPAPYSAVTAANKSAMSAIQIRRFVMIDSEPAGVVAIPRHERLGPRILVRGSQQAATSANHHHDHGQ